MNLNSKKFRAIKPGKMMSSNVGPGELNQAIQNWKNQLKSANVLQECYDRKFYVKPSVTNKLKMDNAKYKQNKVSNEG